MRYAQQGSASLIAMVAFASSAQAQQSPTPPSTTSPTTEPRTDTASAQPKRTQPGQLEEIIVTAQRRFENLQRAAIPVDVVSPAAILKSGATDPTALGSLVPALSVSPNGGGTTSFFVRGVGNFSSNPLFEPAIAFNYDDVYVGRATATAGLFYDLERIEVLKGPQGTLYGRNATGGAINVNPGLPRPGVLSGYLTGTYGNYNAATVEGAVNLPLGKDAAVRLSGTYVRHDPYLSDGTSDEDQGGIRAQALDRLTPNLTARIAIDYEKIGGRGVGASYANGLRYTSGTGFAIEDSGLGRSMGLYDTAAQAFRRGIADLVSGRYLQPFDTTPYINNHIYGAHARIDYDTGFGRLTLIPAWRHSTVDTITDAPGFEAGLRTKNEQLSVEARFAGNRIGMFDYTLGALYFHEKNHALFAIDQQALDGFQDDRDRTKSYSAFGRLTAHLSSRLRAVGGLRYTKDDKSFAGTADSVTVVCVVPSPAFPRCPNAPLFPFSWTLTSQNAVPVPPGPRPIPIGATGAIAVRGGNVVNARLDKGKPTYRAALEFDVADQAMLYASFETGFRSGGFSTAHGYETYQPETIDAWTLGSKNRFFDNRLQLNAEAYYWKYKNQQLAHIGVDLAGQNGNFTQNIGRSTIYGADIETKLLVTASTILSAQLQYLHTKNDSFSYSVPVGALPPVTGCMVGPNASSATLLVVNCSGKPGLNAPKWTLNMGAEKTFEVGEYKVIASVDSQYRSSRYVGFEYQAAELQKGTWQTNAQITFAPRNDRWSIAAFVRNLENDRFVVNAQYFLFGNGLAYVTAPPRTYGVRASVRY